MKVAALIIALVAVALGGFAVWGMFTRAGRQRFDEMDGMYPFFAGIAGAALLLVAGVLWGIATWWKRGG